MGKKMYAFIINPVAGNGKGLRTWKRIKKELEQDQVYYRSFFTKHQGHAEHIATQVAELHQDKMEAIIVIGGDGTVHEVINGLQAYPHVSIGYIPGGSGNDFARGFSIPSNAIRAWESIQQRMQLPVTYYDVGRYKVIESKKTPRHFINGMGIGFDGEVARLTNEAEYKRWLNMFKLGSLAYAVSALKLMLSYQPTNVRLHIDGETKTFENVWLVAVSNISTYGGGINISPQAKPTDGFFHLCIVHNLKRWKLLPLFATVLFGKHHLFNEVTFLQGKRIEIDSDTPLLIHADGEVVGQTPVAVDIQESRQKIVSNRSG